MKKNVKEILSEENEKSEKLIAENNNSNNAKKVKNE